MSPRKPTANLCVPFHLIRKEIRAAAKKLRAKHERATPKQRKDIQKQIKTLQRAYIYVGNIIHI